MLKQLFNFKNFIVCLALVGLPHSCTSPSSEPENQELNLSIAGYDYDRIRAISDGKISIKGVQLRFNFESIYSLNKQAFGPEKQYDITEIGLIPYITRYINNDYRDYTLIPIFISRTFRHRNIFVHTNSGIEKPEDLKGKRVGTIGYGASANTWIRGFLLDEYGLKANDLMWIETTESSDGGKLNTGNHTYYFEDDFPIEIGPIGIDESELLINGDCDALISPITPRAYLEGNPNVKRLFSDVQTVEKEYYTKTKLFPIMHAIAVRKELLEEHPWLAEELFMLYTKAKLMAYENLENTTVMRTTLPWVLSEYEHTQNLMGNNFWSYGIASNKKELEAIVRYVYEQGLVKRQITYEELFFPSTLALKEKGFD